MCKQASSTVGSLTFPFFFSLFFPLITRVQSGAYLLVTYIPACTSHFFKNKVGRLSPLTPRLLVPLVDHLHGSGTIRRPICLLECLLHLSRRHLLLLPVFLWSSFEPPHFADPFQVLVQPSYSIGRSVARKSNPGCRLGSSSTSSKS